MIFISNSVPKSGSSLLVNYQRNFLETVGGSMKGVNKILRNLDCGFAGGFISKPHSNDFLDFISSAGVLQGTAVFKVHTIIYGRLKKLIEDENHIHASLIVRDPIDVFRSARDNLERTGEFKKFETIDGGCAVVNGFFQDIFSSAENTNGTMPIIRYEELMDNWSLAVWKTLPKVIRDQYTAKDVADLIDSKAVRHRARHRLNLERSSKTPSKLTAEERDLLARTFSAFRKRLNYE